MTRWWLLVVVTLSAAGCKTLECGANTLEVDGKCVANVTPPGTECGPGTFYDQNTGRCLDGVFEDGGGLCGDNTTLITDDAGNRVCVGTGGGNGDCSQPLPCPAPTMPNSVSLCGRVFDLADSQPLDDGNPDNGERSRAVELRVYDPIAFVLNPSGATVLKMGQTDACGRFALVNAPLAGSPFIAVATDDTPGGPDDYVQTGIATPATAGEVLNSQRAWVLTRATDVAWSTAAGLPEGQTFGTLGVYIPIFLNPMTLLPPFPGTPAPDVTVAFVDDSGNRTPIPANDFYFDDTAPLVRSMASAGRSATGANGTALYINQPGLGPEGSGVGGAPAGTCWQRNLAASPRGAAYVQERLPTAASCP